MIADGSELSNGNPAVIEENNAVIQLFSPEPLDQDTWASTKEKFIEAITGNENLDRRHDQASGPSRIITFGLSLPVQTENRPLNLARCHALRISPPIQDLETAHKVEIIIRPLKLWQRHRTPGLAIFDMDSTLIQQEVIDELARSVGRYDQVAAVTEAAMRGELDFEASLRARVAKLNGVPSDIWDKLKADVITFTPGARELVRFLKSQGWKTAVLSGGFTPLAYWVKDTLGLDYAYANQLATDDATSTLSGELKPDAPIVGAALKRELLLKLAAENGIPVDRTIAVGDGSNDLLMMGAAGLGVAFNAKPKVQQAAPARLNGESLLDVAYVLGYSKEEVTKALGDALP